MLSYDVVIVGSGIAGMTAAIYLGRANIKVLMIENDTPGGVLNKIWKIENYPGYKEVEGPNLAYNIYSQVNEMGIEYLYENIYKIDTCDNIVVTDNKKIKYKYLIMATGRRSRTLGLDNEDKLIGRGISFCSLCDGNLYKDKDIVVVGGGNTALHDAIYLSNICKKVTLIHRKSEFRGEESSIDRLKKDNIEIIYEANIKEYNVRDNYLEGVTLDNGKKLFCECVFLSIGSNPNSELIDVDKEDGYILVNNNYQTSIDNVLAIGDVIKKDVYQLTTATGDATVAAFYIINSIK